MVISVTSTASVVIFVLSVVGSISSFVWPQLLSATPEVTVAVILREAS